MFNLKAAVAREQVRIIEKKSNDGRRRVVEELGIHGGDDPPFGYVWTQRADGAKNISGAPKHGPLDIDPEKAPLMVEAFERRAAGAARKELVRLTGLSEGGVVDALRNRVYLGIAYSGAFEKHGAHPALVSEELFMRVQRTFARKQPSKVVGRDSSLLSRTLVCGSCGVGHLVHDRSLKSYRCKREGLCPQPVTITDHRIEGYVFNEALFWHAALNPMYEVETNEALPEVTRALAEALEERDELEAAEGLRALRKAQLLSEVDGKIAALEQVLAEVEASNGWLGMSAEAVVRRLVAEGPVEVKEGHHAPQCSDLRAGNEFIREMLRVVVKPVGRGRKVPVADRVEVKHLTPASASLPEPAEETPTPGLALVAGEAQKAGEALGEAMS
jgi:hypothetical protein